MTDQFEAVAARIEQANDYFSLFGESKGDITKHARQLYRQLSRAVHPDYFQGDVRFDRAEDAFRRLDAFYKDALEMIGRGEYGVPTELVKWQSRRATHRVLRSIGSGDLCATYGARTKLACREQDSFCKVAKQAADNDLLQAENDALKRLRGADANERLYVFFPEMLDSFVYRDKGQARQVNVLAQLEGFYDLTQVRRAFPAGLPAIHMAWIWRRVLWALAHAHDHGAVHGAILPEHIMILPEQHGVVLVDWCYASLRNDDADEFPAIKAIVGHRKDWYPAEVLAKRAPSPATDIAMAARCMIELMGGDPLSGNFSAMTAVPRPFRAFLKGCLGTDQKARPQDAIQLLAEFDELLMRLGKPYYPRTFRPFTMPTGTV